MMNNYPFTTEKESMRNPFVGIPSFLMAPMCFDLDELDATAAEAKATYEEIKAYVWEKHHLKVSSLYISQIKRKCGLEVGQNYNLSKSENPYTVNHWYRASFIYP